MPSLSNMRSKAKEAGLMKLDKLIAKRQSVPVNEFPIPVKIGKVTVRPGDIIMGDIDGVICIPREIAYEVLLRAEGIERNEVDIFSWVRQGDTISEIIDKGGYF